MLKIGKTNQYYTLWDVSTRTEYTANRQPYQVTSYSYIQNLSMDESRAKEKASQKGCKDLSVDSDLYGRNSWETSNKPTWEPEVIAPSCFQFGKYKGKNIKEMIDNDCKENPDEWSDFQSYLKWYFQELDIDDQNELLKAFDEFPVLEMSKSFLEFIGMVKYKKRFVELDEVPYIKVMDKIKDGKCGVYVLSNFSGCDGAKAISPDHWEIRIQPHGASDKEMNAFFKYNSFGIKLLVHCPDMEMKMRYYNGFYYWVPAGMRSFKKTIMNLKQNDDEFGSYRITHIVTTGDTGYKNHPNS